MLIPDGYIGLLSSISPNNNEQFKVYTRFDRYDYYLYWREIRKLIRQGKIKLERGFSIYADREINKLTDKIWTDISMSLGRPPTYIHIENERNIRHVEEKEERLGI